MFSLLNPIFLWAATAAAIPLVLHLMQRRRIVRLPFSTIQFLKMAQKRSSNRIRMENFLLWLLRTLLMLLIVFAFAMPMLRTRTFGTFLTKSNRDIAIVLDGSYSMNYNRGKDTVWNMAIDSAIAIVNGLEDGDQVCIFLANDDIKPVIEQLNPDREFAVAQLKSLEVDTTSSQLCPAVIAAYNSLKQEERRREREIHIITDGQALPWRSFGNQPPSPGYVEPGKSGVRSQESESSVEGTTDNGQQTTDKTSSIDLLVRRSLGEGGWNPEKVGKRTAFFVTLPGVSAPENVAPYDIEIQPQLIMADMPSKVKVKVGHSGQKQSSSVSVHVDDKELVRRSAILGEDGAEDITFTLPPLESGIHPARIETPADNLPVDNNFHFLIRVKETLPCLCVGPQDDAFYIMKALKPVEMASSAMDVKWIGVEELANEDIFSYTCVFLCNALPLPGQVILQLEQYIRTGGLLVIFPGNGAAISDYETWSCLPGFPSAIVEIPMKSRKKLLRWQKPQHLLLRTLKIGAEGGPIVTTSREMRWEKLHESGESLISAGAKTPFLLCRDFGTGKVLFFSVSADRSWSSFPLSPFFLPIVHQIVQFGAGIAGSNPYLLTTRSLSLAEHLPAADKSSTLLDPDNESVSLRSSIVNNKTVLRAENLMKPGIYHLSKLGSEETTPALAINLDRTESNLTPVKPDDIQDIIGTKNIYVADNKEELLRLVKEHRVGRTLGELALWLAFIVSLVEIFYANQKSKSVPPLSETIEIEASGKVRAKGA